VPDGSHGSLGLLLGEPPGEQLGTVLRPESVQCGDLEFAVRPGDDSGRFHRSDQGTRDHEVQRGHQGRQGAGSLPHRATPLARQGSQVVVPSRRPKRLPVFGTGVPDHQEFHDALPLCRPPRPGGWRRPSEPRR